MTTTERGARRAETQTVGAYLRALAEPRPRRSREWLTTRRAEVVDELAGNSIGPVDRLRLVQARIDIDAELLSTKTNHRTSKMRL
jgi:hypothetical protein